MSKLGYQPYRRDDSLRDPKSSFKRILVGSLFSYGAALFFVSAWLRPGFFCPAGGVDIPTEISDATVRAWHDEGFLLSDGAFSDKDFDDLALSPHETASSRTLVLTGVNSGLSAPTGDDGSVPPAKEPPPSILLPGPMDVSRCWTSQGVEVSATLCDDLPVLKDALTQRLHIVAKCRDELAGQGAYGDIVLGIEVDYSRGALSFWKAPKTDIRNAEEIVSCIKEKLESLSPVKEAAQYSRYMIFVPIRFPSPAELAEQLLAEERAGRVTEAGEGERPDNVVRVTRDNVRLRTAPVDGDVKGTVSAPEEVLLLDEESGWCLVVTAREEKGWMVCWGLDLAEGGK